MGPTLLSLPAEIRLMIWEHALPDKDEPIVVHHPPPFKFCYERAGDAWALYRTCRAIRNELPPMDSAGITLVLHLFPWQKPTDIFSGPRPHGLESLWDKFQRMAPYVERLRITSPIVGVSGGPQLHALQLRRIVQQAPMPRLRTVEVQPQGWRAHDWSMAFQLVNSLGLGKQDVTFLGRDGHRKNAPADLHMIPEWARLRQKSPERMVLPDVQLQGHPPAIAV